MTTSDPSTAETVISSSEEADSTGWTLSIKIIYSLFFFLMWITNVVGNTCTLIAFFRDFKLRTVNNYYICNLAITDLVIGLSSLPFYSVYTILYYSWPFGYTWCKGWSVLDFWVCAESSLTIIMISTDRFLMVTLGPPSYPKLVTKCRTLIAIAISWVLAFLLYGPAIIGYNIWRGYSIVEDNDCDVEFSDDFTFTMITSVIEFFIPFIMVSVLNGLLYWTILKRNHAVGPIPSSTTKSEISALRERKAAKNLAILVGAFAICWTPYTASTVIITICSDCVNQDLYQFFTWMVWFNSSLNPFLYAVSNPRIRRHFLTYLTLGACKPRTDNNETTLS